jgi:hypothetical protein
MLPFPCLTWSSRNAINKPFQSANSLAILEARFRTRGQDSRFRTREEGGQSLGEWKATHRSAGESSRRRASGSRGAGTCERSIAGFLAQQRDNNLPNPGVGWLLSLRGRWSLIVVLLRSTLLLRAGQSNTGFTRSVVVALRG